MHCICQFMLEALLVQAVKVTACFVGLKIGARFMGATQNLFISWLME